MGVLDGLLDDDDAFSAFLLGRMQDDAMTITFVSVDARKRGSGLCRTLVKAFVKKTRFETYRALISSDVTADDGWYAIARCIASAFQREPYRLRFKNGSGAIVDKCLRDNDCVEIEARLKR